MNKCRLFFCLFFVFLLFCISLQGVNASSAGVGVLNVPPKYGEIRVVQQNEGFIRIYLTVSDYNSWGDIYKISVILEDKETEEIYASFVYQQYHNVDSFEKVDWFNESGGQNLLVREKCSFETSPIKDSVDDRCDIELLFVFKSTWFTRLKIVVEDREGSQSISEIDYLPSDVIPPEEYNRDENNIIIPWFNGPINVVIPPFFPNLLAVIAGIVGAGICFRKKRISARYNVNYEK